MNLPFAAMPGAAFISEHSTDIIPENIREAQKRYGVPCLSQEGCRFLALIAAIKKPAEAIDIGCGIGASTTALALGAPDANITALDANPERAALAGLLTSARRVSVHHADAFAYLKENDKSYDMAFVDSIKKDYSGIWHILRPRLSPGAVVLFDDVLLHGYTTEEEAEMPLKYRDGARELKAFLDEIKADAGLSSQIIPLSGGILLVSLK